MAPRGSMSQKAYGVPVGDWTTGCCGCFSDCKSMCCSFFCPCIMVGRNAEIVTDGTSDACTVCCLHSLLSMVGLGCLYSFGFRQRLRQKYVLEAKPCGDCCMHCLFGCCAIAQETRELTNRGWEPKIGFAGNMRQFQARGLPPPPQAMIR